MQVYEIRILNPNFRPLFVVKEQYQSDTAAVHDAKKLAAGKGVEVWTEMSCIYRSPAMPQANKAA